MTSTSTKDGAAPSALVVVASTRAADGTYTDRTGPVLVDWLRRRGFSVPDATVVADRDIEGFLNPLLEDSASLPRVLLTTGGTGITPDDRTIEAVEPHLEQKLDGVVHAFFARGLAATPHAVLSRAVAGTVGRTFVMTLPGSRGAVKDAIATLDPLIEHLVDMLEGKHAH